MNIALGDTLPKSEYGKWEKKCLEVLNRTATLELHLSKKDVILATKEPKLSFVGGLGSVGKLKPLRNYAQGSPKSD